MGYLVCEKCKSYYKLQEGESPTDFLDKCNCGGKLRYAENIDIVSSEWNQAPVSDICPNCGAKNINDANFCASCGKELKNIEKTKSSKSLTITDQAKTWWNQRTTGGKIATTLIACCLGIILIVGIFGLASPDKNTQTYSTVPSTNVPSNSTQSTTSTVPTTSSFEPIKLSGKGQEATNTFHLNRGMAKFKMTHTGSSNFAIVLYSSDGDYIDLLVNEIGSFDGSKATPIDESWDYMLDIGASGPWEVTITQ